MANASYRHMLLRLGKAIRDDELQSMKFMCQDIIPGRRLEEITSTLDLWKALEERDQLGADNTTFIRDLVSSTTDGRTDVLRILSDYECEGSPGQPTLSACHISQEIGNAFNIIVDQIGREWRPLARALGLSHTELENCAEKHQRDLKEQIREALMTWARKSDSGVTISELQKALNKCEQRMLAGMIS